MRYAGWFLLRALLSLALLICLASKAVADEWVRVRSPHFEIIADVSQKRAREIALRFEQMRSIFEKLVSAEKLKSPIPLQIIAFRTSKELTDVMPRRNGKPMEGIAGWFLQNDDMNFVALNASEESGFPVAYHEYAHTVLHASFSNIPLWFDEGVACYYETTKILYGQIEIGDTPKYAPAVFAHRGLMPVTELFAVTGNSKTYWDNDLKRAMFYQQSWLVVHYLFDKQKLGQFAKYAELRSKQRTPIPEAIQAAFGISPKEFDAEISAYGNLGQRQIYRSPEFAQFDATKFTVDSIEDLDAAAAVANLRLHSRENHDEAVDEFRKILVKNPAHFEANLGLAYAALLSKNYEEAERCLKAAATVDKKNAREHYLYGMLQLGRVASADEKQQQIISAWDHLKSAVRLQPEFADAHRLLSTAYSEMGDANSAINEARTAAALNQGNLEYFAHLGKLLFDHQKYDQARVVYEQLAASSDPLLSTLASQRLESIKEKEGDHSASPPAAVPDSTFL